ncbi:MAG: hypothetical protein GWN84_13900 [Gammaproteobacteria bacterium]|nr:hypothetical protein [Gammaproteobacteria bacterium]NIR58688.1 hypothetical protein [Gammaproteobacteria bacterium]NIR90349.1 hypothetical protein [Gammaproteobacteria bacterium]
MDWRASKRCIGLTLECGGLNVVESRHEGRAHVVGWARAMSPIPALEAARRGETQPLAEALLAVRERIGRRFVPIQLALPDPVVSTAVFELEEIPPREQARRALAAWRLARDYQREPAELACTAQYLGRDGDRHLLLVFGIERRLREAVLAAVREAGLQVRVADAAAAYRFNHARASLAPEAAWITMEGEYWSMMLWDAQRRPRYLRAAWRDRGPDPGGEAEAILRELERATRAYTASGRAVSHVQLTVPAEEREALLPVFAERLGESLEELPVHLGFANGGLCDVPSLTRLAASVYR